MSSDSPGFCGHSVTAHLNHQVLKCLMTKFFTAKLTYKQDLLTNDDCL